MIEILAALSAAAATGIRIALPLLVIGLLQGEKLWSGVPILSSIYPPVVLGVLTSGSLVELIPSWLIGVIGGSLAFMLQLVQAGWFYRWRSLPQWLPFLQDGLSVLLVYLAVQVPLAGGIIALFLLGLAVYNSQQLHRWFIRQHQSRK